MEKNKNKTSVGVAQNASCWICRRTHKEVDDFYFSVTIDTKDGELPKWLCLAHIIPINYEGKLNEEKGFSIYNLSSSILSIIFLCEPYKISNLSKILFIFVDCSDSDVLILSIFLLYDSSYCSFDF